MGIRAAPLSVIGWSSHAVTGFPVEPILAIHTSKPPSDNNKIQAKKIAPNEQTQRSSSEEITSQNTTIGSLWSVGEKGVTVILPRPHPKGGTTYDFEEVVAEGKRLVVSPEKVLGTIHLTRNVTREF